MNTPNPLLPQGTLPQRGKTSIYFKILMIVAVHTVLIGGILMVGCKDATKDKASTTPTDETAASTASNSTPMSTELSTPAPSTPTAAGTAALPTQPLASTPAPMPTPTTLAPVAPPIGPLNTAPATPSAGKEYVIVSGDTLGAIAKRNGISIKALQEANPGVDAKKLRIGNKLQIPGSSATASSTSSTGSSAATADSSAPASGDATIYTVKSGDVLMRIAKTHGTTVQKILAFNDMKTTSIKVGQKLKLPVMKVASAEPIPNAMVAPSAAAPAASEAPAATPAPKTMAN